MRAVGINSYQTGVDNFRNIVTDPLDAKGFDTVLPSYELLKKTGEFISARLGVDKRTA